MHEMNADRPLSVMVVEDSDDFRRVLCQYLRLRGFDPVLDAPDGQAAWERLQDEAVDLLITDINMPRMNGIELMRLAHQRHPGLPVVVVTGYQHELLRLDAPTVRAILIKPFKMPQLDAEIARIFQAGKAS
jgi:CheY-like chemotaxis protein